MDEQMKRVAIVASILILMFAGIAIAYVLKNYTMNAVNQKTNLRLYYNADLASDHVIVLDNFNWTAATGVIVGDGTVLNMWARNEGNIIANFSFQISNPVNCSVAIAPQILLNFQPGTNTSVTLTLSNVLDDPKWQITVNTP